MAAGACSAYDSGSGEWVLTLSQAVLQSEFGPRPISHNPQVRADSHKANTCSLLLPTALYCSSLLPTTPHCSLYNTGLLIVYVYKHMCICISSTRRQEGEGGEDYHCRYPYTLLRCSLPLIPTIHSTASAASISYLAYRCTWICNSFSIILPTVYT